MTALEKFKNKVAKNLHICVGLDTDKNKIPEHLRTAADPILEFNKIVIENTCETAAAYKINFAFYEKYGSAGFDTIHKTLELIPPGILTIADAKRGDIGNTSQMYASSAFDYFNFDSITLHPYMGFDSLSPFLDYKDKLNFILALTSNAGSSDFEKQKLENGNYLYQQVMEKVVEWDRNKNCGFVFGATNLEELILNIKKFNEMPVLLPGVGAQGGSLEDIVRTFIQQSNKNFIINISRALIYADESKSFGAAVKNKMKEYDSIIQSF